MDRKADKVLMNGLFYSVDRKGTLTRSKAVAIKDGKFVYVGDDAGVRSFAGEQTEIIDLEGKMAIPGLSDAHIHASFSGLQMYCINLYGKTVQEGKSRQDYIDDYKQIITDYLKKNPDTEMIRGAGFDAGLFIADEAGFPTCFDLDEVSRDKPIVLRSYCFHYAWVNSKALEMAGIDKDTPEPRNGIIKRDLEGNPTGFFQEIPAIDMIVYGVPGYDFSVEEYKNVIKEYQRTLGNRYGITMIFDALATKNAIQAYKELAAEGLLKMRVRGCHYANPAGDPGQFDQLSSRFGKDNVNDKYRIDTVKFFMDGTGTAFYMGEPFEEDFLKVNNLPEGYRGFPIWGPDETREAFLKISEAGYQIHVHAMGDGAVTQTLDAFEYIREKTGKEGNRNVIAHIMYMQEKDKKRMGDLNVIAAVMPCWMCVETIYDYYYIPLFGKKRSERFYPMKTLKDAGVVVTSGTDFPVTVPPNPFCEIQYGISRSVARSYPVFNEYQGVQIGPEENPAMECFSLKEIIQSLTINGAYQHGIDDIAGSIEVGKSADLIVLSQNLENTPVLDIENTYAVMTMFEGEKVFEAES